MLNAVCLCSQPSHIRRTGVARSPMKKSSTSELSTPANETLNCNKTSTITGSKSPLLSSTKKRTSGERTTPRSSSRGKTSSVASGKFANHLSARKSAAEPQHASSIHDESRHSRTSDNNQRKMVGSGRLRASGSTDPKPADELEQGPSTKVDSTRQSVSTKQPVSARSESRPASSLAVYVCFNDRSVWYFC